MTDLRQKILESVAKNLREFGYPDARADNLLTDYIFSRFLASNLKDERESLVRHGGPRLGKIVDELLAECEKVKPPEEKKQKRAKKP